jgi:hypothetical protein
MGWAQYVAHRFSAGKTEGKRPLERLRRRRVDNIKINIEEMGWMDMVLISISQNMDKLRDFVKAVMNFRVP